jgi:hypothetical protein
MTGRSAARARVGEALTLHLASFRRDGQLGETESEGHDRNRGRFISNTLESRMTLVSNWRYAGVPVPNSRPAPLAPEQGNHDAVGCTHWRDPDSNWGHHDFQSCSGAIQVLRICGRNARLRSARALPGFSRLSGRFLDVTAHGDPRWPFRPIAARHRERGLIRSSRDDQHPTCRRHPAIRVSRSETRALDEVADAYERMMLGAARYRMVLTTGA